VKIAYSFLQCTFSSTNKVYKIESLLIHNNFWKHILVSPSGLSEQGEDAIGLHRKINGRLSLRLTDGEQRDTSADQQQRRLGNCKKMALNSNQTSMHHPLQLDYILLLPSSTPKKQNIGTH
jgi:hypothetical protein